MRKLNTGYTFMTNYEYHVKVTNLIHGVIIESLAVNGNCMHYKNVLYPLSFTNEFPLGTNNCKSLTVVGAEPE